MPAIHGGIEQKLALNSVQGCTLLRESLKAGLRRLGRLFFFFDKKKSPPITPKRKTATYGSALRTRLGSKT